MKKLECLIESSCQYCWVIAKVLGLTSNIVLLCLFSLCIYFWSTWFNDDAPVLEYQQGTISSDVVKPFESVVIYQPYKKFRECPGTVTRYFNGECGTLVISQGKTHAKAGTHGNLIYKLSVPDELLSGQCSWNVQVQYFCNPLDYIINRQLYNSPPIKFKVIRQFNDSKSSKDLKEKPLAITTDQF